MTKFEMAQYGIRTPYWYIWTYFQAIFQFFGKNDISKIKVIEWQNLKWLNMVLEHLIDIFEPIFKPFFNFLEKMTFKKITLSYSKWTFWHFRTLGHLNGSSSFNIHHRDLSMVPFNSELNSTHFCWKNFGLHAKPAGRPLEERASSTLFPPRP